MRFLLALCLSVVSLSGAGELSGRRAPGFALLDSTLTRYHDPQDYRGKILLVDIMLTTCPHCQQLSGVLEEAARRYKGRVQVLSIVIPPDNQTTVAKYIAEKKITNPILFDCGQVTASYLKATPQNSRIEVPHLFIIDEQGMIRNDYGYSEATRQIFEGKALFAELDRMLKQAPASKSKR
ncbi:MAG: TlpA family protein disulfide reductase [Bryobacterales bacterium]|nr:TlpA family protein disulfide reductase [Bryobacterales bacterium]